MIDFLGAFAKSITAIVTAGIMGITGLFGTSSIQDKQPQNVIVETENTIESTVSGVQDVVEVYVSPTAIPTKKPTPTPTLEPTPILEDIVFQGKVYQCPKDVISKINEITSEKQDQDNKRDLCDKKIEECKESCGIPKDGRANMNEIHISVSKPSKLECYESCINVDVCKIEGSNSIETLGNISIQLKNCIK